MSGPIVFISKSRIKEGKLEDFKRFVEAGVESIKVDKPGTVVFLAYLNENANEVSIIHVFPDAPSMDLHLQGADERSKAAFEFIEPVGIEIYGKPTDGVLAMMSQIDLGASTLSVRSEHLGGYIRLK